MSLKIVTPPAVEPISLTEAKMHLRLAVTDVDAADYTAEDAAITRVITQAREYVEHQGLHSLITQTWDFYLDAFPDQNIIRLPLPPLQSVTSISYIDADGADAVFTDFEVLTHSGKIKKTYGVAWPAIYPESEIVIRFVCGFGTDGEDVPARLRGAMFLLINHWHENSSETIAKYGVVSERIKLGVDALINEFRLKEVRI